MSKILPPDPAGANVSVAFSISAGGRAHASSGVDGELLGGDFLSSSPAFAGPEHRMLAPSRRPWRDAHTFATDAPPVGAIEANVQRAWSERATGHYADEQIDAVEDNVNTNIKRITKHEDFAPDTFVTRSTKSSRVRRRETLGLSYVEDHSSDGSGADPDEEQARQDQAAKANAAGLDAALARKLQMRLKAAMYGVDPLTFFQRFDRDHGGTIDTEELRLLIRATLKIPPLEISDAEIKKLVEALDDDGSGDLDIEELADFVDRGAATFFEGTLDDEAEKKLSEKLSPGTGILTSRVSPIKQEATRRHAAASKGRLHGLPFSIGHLQELMADEDLDNLRAGRGGGLASSGDGGGHK